MIFLEIIQTECPILLKYAKGVAKTGIGLTNTYQQVIDKVTLCHQEMPLGAPAGLSIKFGSIISSQHQRNLSRVQLKYLITAVKNHTAVDVTKDRKSSIDTTKSSIETRKQVFGCTAINDQISKQKMHRNGIKIESLMDTDTDVTITSP